MRRNRDSGLEGVMIIEPEVVNRGNKKNEARKETR